MSKDPRTAEARLIELIGDAADRGSLRRVVLSKPNNASVKRAELRQIMLSRGAALQLETFTTDNKAYQRNIPLQQVSIELGPVILGYRQVNIMTAAGDCEYRRSKSGNSVLLGADKLEGALSVHKGADSVIQTNDRTKAHILSGAEPFLQLLDVSDARGRVYDKKQSKFRQINKFLEHIQQVERYLPHDRIRICDLCCGKSYLSFAVYHYFRFIRGMEVSMTGVDLKLDVIDYCSQIAKKLEFDGLDFVCGDINDYHTDELPQLVISLHACDVATDVVLQKAAGWHTPVILSTPCCHHELNHTLNCPELSFISDYSMLRQKLCDAATDALRLCLLESQGYTTAALELIDPEETPKNIMLRAILRRDFDPAGAEAAALRQRYEQACRFLIQ